MSAAEIRDLHAGYKGTDVLRGISVSVARGACVGVLGPNGAGKSTLLKAFSGQVAVRSGRRLLDGKDTSSWPAYRLAREGVRWVGEPRPIYPSLTVVENLEIGGISRRGEVAQRMAEVYELLPVLEERRDQLAGSMSGGQHQMLAIGQALMSGPRYLCLDEPSLGLAQHVITSLSQLIGRLSESGVGILWAEQFPEVALRRCTEIVVLGAGRVVLSGRTDEVTREQLEHAYLGAAPAGPQTGSRSASRS